MSCCLRVKTMDKTLNLKTSDTCTHVESAGVVLGPASKMKKEEKEKECQHKEFFLVERMERERKLETKSGGQDDNR